MAKKWFQKGIREKPPYNLGGWHKNQSPETRRRLALASRDGRLNLHDRRLSAARALQALANVTQDPGTKRAAQADANYFFSLL